MILLKIKKFAIFTVYIGMFLGGSQGHVIKTLQGALKDLHAVRLGSEHLHEG